MATEMLATVILLIMKIRLPEKHILSILICTMQILCQALKAEPKLVDTMDDMDAFGDMVWNSLNEDNKVSLFIRYINIEDGSVQSKIYNKNK